MIWALWGLYIASDSCRLCPDYLTVCGPRFYAHERCRQRLYQFQLHEFKIYVSIHEIDHSVQVLRGYLMEIHYLLVIFLSFFTRVQPF